MGTDFVDVVPVPAVDMLFLQVRYESVIESEDIIVGLDEVESWYFLTDSKKFSNAWIIYDVARKVEVLLQRPLACLFFVPHTD